MLNSSTRHQIIQEGAIFRRKLTSLTKETVEVIEIGRDKMGIPHVRFHLSLACGGGGAAIEERTLSLDAFYSRYRERVN